MACVEYVHRRSRAWADLPLTAYTTVKNEIGFMHTTLMITTIQVGYLVLFVLDRLPWALNSWIMRSHGPRKAFISFLFTRLNSSTKNIKCLKHVFKCAAASNISIVWKWLRIVHRLVDGLIDRCHTHVCHECLVGVGSFGHHAHMISTKLEGYVT
jgi:hypothetical protein